MGQENRINSMGTTAAMLAFGEEMNVCACNLGDSQDLSDLSSGEKLGQLSLGSCP